MYETRSERLLAQAGFLRRLVLHLLAALVLLLVSLAAGMAGYMGFEHLPAIDAFLNAAMLLGGMGPVNTPATFAGKLFAGCYAIYAGLVFIVTVALILTPVAHRVLHKFHADERL